MKRLADQPFALLGVNTDDNRRALKRAMKKENITWRSWWEGGLRGPISTQWQIANYPTIYVIDASGVIRYVGAGPANVNMEAIEQVVDDLLEELASSKR